HENCGCTSRERPPQRSHNRIAAVGKISKSSLFLVPDCPLQHLRRVSALQNINYALPCSFHLPLYDSPRAKSPLPLSTFQRPLTSRGILWDSQLFAVHCCIGFRVSLRASGQPAAHVRARQQTAEQ